MRIDLDYTERGFGTKFSVYAIPGDRTGRIGDAGTVRIGYDGNGTLRPSEARVVAAAILAAADHAETVA